MKITRRQIKKLILQEMSGYRNPADVRRGQRMARDAQFRGTGMLKPGAFAAGTHSPPPLVDPQVKAAADYIGETVEGTLSSPYVDEEEKQYPEYIINRAVEAMQYETNFTDVMFPGVDLDEVKAELYRRFGVEDEDQNIMSETRYRDKKYRRSSDVSDMIVGDSGATEFYTPSDPIRGPGNIYQDIRFKSSAREHALRQVNFIIKKFNLDRQIAFSKLQEEMLTNGYMIDYDPSAMTITFENKSDTSDPYVLDVSDLLY